KCNPSDGRVVPYPEGPRQRLIFALGCQAATRGRRHRLMANTDSELTYTLQVEEVRPGDFVARALAFPNLLALGDTPDQAITRAPSLLTYQVRDARAHGEPLPRDVSDAGAAGRSLVVVRVAA